MGARLNVSLAYNLANFLRRLVLPRRVKHWSLTTLREKLIMAEVAVPKALFEQILARIARLTPLCDNGNRGR